MVLDTRSDSLVISFEKYSYNLLCIDPTTMVSTHLQSLMYWERPARSMVALTASLSFIYMTRQYSLLQIGAAAMTVITGLNLAYVFISMSAQRIFSDNNEPALHPYR
jgi:hypothetical protein